MSVELSFAKELVKVADATGYKPVQEEKVLLAEGIEVVRKLPEDTNKAVKRITEALKDAGPAGWSHPQVAVPVKELGDLEARGFSETRLGLPLPGESWFDVSWRKKNLHAHRMGPLYLFHWDKSRAGGLAHLLHDVLPALEAKYKGKAPRFVKAHRGSGR